MHKPGRRQRARLEAAHAEVASLLGCEPREIVFTASGSEANALALRGTLSTSRGGLLTSSIEHPALLATADQLEREGAKVTRIQPESTGEVRLEDFERHLVSDEKPALCSLMAANNETGVLQPAAELARRCRAVGVRFHCDAVQAAGRLPLLRAMLDADLLTLSGHKLGAPAGVGVLVARRELSLSALVPGHQENGRRGGTPNVAFAEAMALALRLALEEQSGENARLQRLRDHFESEVLARIPSVRVHGASAPRLPHVSNLCFTGADGETLLIALDLEGISVSSGAACASGTLRPSHVLLAMGLTSRDAQASLRFSMGRGTTEAEVTAVVAALERHVPRSRQADGSLA